MILLTKGEASPKLAKDQRYMKGVIVGLRLKKLRKIDRKMTNGFIQLAS